MVHAPVKMWRLLTVAVCALALFAHASTAAPFGMAECPHTCDDAEDARWAAAVGLETCDRANNKTLLDVVGEARLRQIVADLHVTPFEPEAAQCMLSNTKFPRASEMLRECVPLLSPPHNASNMDRQLASMGVMRDPRAGASQGQLISLCQPEMPCKVFNRFLINMTLVEEAFECGHEAALRLLRTVVSKDFAETSLLAVAMQNSVTGHTDNCYCNLKNGKGVRGPMYGPIFYANLKLLALISFDLVAGMPGCRVLCDSNTGCNATFPAVP